MIITSAMALSKPIKTRLKLEYPIFRHPKELSELSLPTYCDVMKYYLFVRHELKPEATSKEPTVSEILDIVMNKVETIWLKASIPVVSKTRMLQMGKTYHDKYRNILRSKGRKGTERYDSIVTSFLNESNRLFDVAACKCKIFSDCKCQKEKRVPKIEQTFLTDQRTTRKMTISSVDKAVSKVLNKREERKHRSMQQQLQYNQQSAGKGFHSDAADISEKSDTDPGSDEEPTNNPDHPSTSVQASTTCDQMRVELPTVASICDRTGVSDRVATAIASAVLKDVGMITDVDKSKVIDRM